LPTPPARYIKGDILFRASGKEPVNLLQQSPASMRTIRGNDIAMIFQEPMTSLNPVFTCGHQVQEAIRLHQQIARTAARRQTIELFQQVQLPQPERLYHRYPHELSGGQKQRVMIAMAMSCQPRLLICDEPTTALDVLVQKEILQLIRSLQRKNKMSVLFISHDIQLVSEIADQIAVLYRGDLVEQGPAHQIIHHAQHPYTKALLACRPGLYERGTRLPVVSDFLTEPTIDNALQPPQTTSIPASPRQPVSACPILNIDQQNVWYPTA